MMTITTHLSVLAEPDERILAAKATRTMDEITFDTLTRSVGTDAGTRRTLLRLLAGAALATVAARFGMAEGTAAKPASHHGAAPRQQTASRRQSAGKGKGKGKGKGHHKPPKDPKPPCPDGQGQCRDGTCLPFDQCCEDDPAPLCGKCEEVYCNSGTWACRPATSLDTCPQSCPEGTVVCPMVTGNITGLPSGCCQADRVFPDQWYGTSNLFCRPEHDPGSYWCTIDGLPGT
jgi:hypothetical protein